jgi:RNA polymerase subunit RPABC4/transcription elongation factor Spt4
MRSTIDWKRQPLGIEPDLAIAKRLGVTRIVVARERRKRGIPAPPISLGRRRRIDWDNELLGIETDYAIAERLDITCAAVLNARRCRGIPAAVPQGRSPTNIDWDNEPLGVETDNAIAERLGVTGVAVLKARHRRGIAPAPRSARKPIPRRQPRIIVDWASQPLGIDTDYAIAKRLHVSQPTVTLARQRRGIPPVCPPSPRRVIPFLGKMPDDVLARELGLSLACVQRHRRKAGIAKFEPGKDGA